ncbi:hypothetical protein P7C70_g1512, partial [Phenoliferia sp. Uapishka_3]
MFGAFCIIWSRIAAHLAPAFGGFALGLFIQSLRSDGLIRPVGLRYILLLAPAVAGFILGSVQNFNTFCVLVSTAALGSMALVIGVDCFTCVGLKEFFVFNLGFSSLFPSLNNHYVLSLGIQVELGVIAALFLCMGAWQYLKVYDLLIAKRRGKAAEKRSKEIEEEEAGQRIQRMSKADLDDWEEKYGHGGRSPSSVAALLGPGPPSSFDLTRARTRSEMSERQRSSSYDMLPPIDFEAAGGSSPRTPRSPDTPGTSHHRLSSGFSGSEWDSYLASRKVLTATEENSPKSHHRRQSTLTSSPLFSPNLALDTIVSEDGHGGDNTITDDDVPLALLSPTLSASSTLPDLPSQALAGRPRPQSLAFPSFESTPRLSRPQSLAFPSTTTLTALARPQLSESRRNTMIDLAEEATKGTHERPPRLERRSNSERIILGEWNATKSKPIAPLPPARIMDAEELEEKHRKRISQMQAPVLESVRTDAEVAKAKAAYAQRVQREASDMKAKERSREAADRRDSRRSSSIGNLGGLLDKFSGASPLSPVEGTTFGGGFAAPPAHQRRQSAQSLGKMAPSTSRQSIGQMTPSSSRQSEEPRPRQNSNLGPRRESQRLSGLNKVAAWQDGRNVAPGSSDSSGSGSAGGRGQGASRSPDGQGLPKSKSKLDWLGY